MKKAENRNEEKRSEVTWQMSHLGSLFERHWRRSLWCLLASLFAAWTSTSHFAHRAASSAQQITVAGAFSHTSHWIFIFFFFLSLLRSHSHNKYHSNFNPRKLSLSLSPLFRFEEDENSIQERSNGIENVVNWELETKDPFGPRKRRVRILYCSKFVQQNTSRWLIFTR
jgi:hypothetical protein